MAKGVLIEIQPIDPTTNTRVMLRFSGVNDDRVTGLNSVRWWPGLSKLPVLSQAGFDGDFGADISVGQASFDIVMAAARKVDANSPRYRWAGAPVAIYAGNIGAAWGAWTQRMAGRVTDYGINNDVLSVQATVDTQPFEVPVLVNSYAGTGGAEGGPDLKNKPKPMALGRCNFVEPVLIDATNSVYQVHGYGTVNGITGVYERAASFGDSIGNYATYAALVAATIPPGRWATCHASGLFRLGAPPYGLVTCDVEGDSVSGYVRMTAAVIQRIAAIAGISGALLDSTSFSAFATAAPANINLYQVEQATFLDLARMLVRPCNAMAGVALTGKMFVQAFSAIASPTITLNRQGAALPPVLDLIEQKVTPPYWRLEMLADRAWRIHGLDEIAFNAELIDRGNYDAATTYREGNIVFQSTNGKRYLYINPTPTVGSTPPNVTYWQELQAADPAIAVAATTANWSGVTGAGKPADYATRNINGNLITDPTFDAWTKGSNITIMTAAAAAPGWLDPPSAFIAKVDLTIATTAGAYENALIPITAGETAYARILVARDTTASQSINQYFTWYDHSGANIGSGGTRTVMPSMLAAAGAYYPFEISAIAPAGAAYFRHVFDRATGVGGLGQYRVSLPFVGKHAAGADKTGENSALGVLAGGIISSSASIEQATDKLRTLGYGVQVVELADGASHTYATSWTGGPLPTVIPLSGGDFGASDFLDVSVVNPTASGFTAKIKRVSGSITYTDQTETGTVTGTAPRVLEMNKDIAAEAFDGKYTAQFDVTVQNLYIAYYGIRMAGAVTIGIWANDGAGWVMVATKELAGDTLGNTTTHLNVQVTFSRAGMGLNDDFGLSIENTRYGGSAITSWDNVTWRSSSSTPTVTAANQKAKYLIIGGAAS